MVLVVTCSAALLTGCTTTSDKVSRADYQTVARDPRHDSDAARVANEQAIAAMNAGDDANAERLFKQSLAADITFGPAHNNLGKLYYHQRNLYLAAWEFEYASKLMPYQAEPRNNLGLVFESIGKLNEAVTYFDEALRLESDNPEIIGNNARARCRRGDNDTQTREMLEHVVLSDTRPAWVDWARQRLILLPQLPATQPQPLR